MSDALASMLASPNADLVDVVLYYLIKKNASGSRKISVLTDEKAKELMDKASAVSEDPDPDVKKAEVPQVEVLNTQWKQASWKEQNTIIDKAQRINPQTQQSDIDWNMVRDTRIKSLLVAWDLVSQGSKIPVTPENIDNLPFEIVLGLYEKFEKTVGVDDEEEGK